MSDTGIPMRISAGRWVRHTFVRENLASALKTFAWLGPLTLLIWVYAERAQVVELSDVSFPIDVRTDDPNRFVQFDNFEGNVTAKLTGPRSRIEALRQDIMPDARTNQPKVLINIGPRATGSYPIDAAKQVSDTDLFRYSGVNVTELRPQMINVLVDLFEERELEVQRPQNVTNLVSAPTFVPARVRVRAPAGYFQNAGPVTVEADLKSVKIVDKGPQKVVVNVVSPQLDQYPAVTIAPKTVEASIDVGESSRLFNLPPVPIWEWTPHGFADQFKVELAQEFVVGVQVSGPIEKIAQIEEGKFALKAKLVISASDRPAAGESKIKRLVTIEELPEGVTVVEPPQPVEFSLIPRAAP